MRLVVVTTCVIGSLRFSARRSWPRPLSTLLISLPCCRARLLFSPDSTNLSDSVSPQSCLVRGFQYREILGLSPHSDISIDSFKMVFPGRFSTGCLRCRQRKVKCDEAKPTCRRCYNYGKPCLGYTDQFHFRHSSAQKPGFEKPSPTASSPQTSEASARSISPESREPTKNLATGTGVQLSPAIIRQPTQPYDNVSLTYFVRRFVSPDEGDGFPGHFSFLPDLYDHYKHGLLETATLSVAQMAAYNQFGGEELRTHSFRNYGRAIRSLQESIQTDSQAVDDKVIATVLLLCTFKDISGEGLGDPKEHAPGLFYLLEKRGPAQIGTRRGAELFLLALLRLQIYSFLHEDDTYTDPGAIATVMGLFDPLLRALSMMSRTLSLRHRLSKHMEYVAQRKEEVDPWPCDESKTGPEDEQLLLQECFEMLDQFHVWDQEAPSYWHSTFEGRAAPTVLGEMGSRMTYCDSETACIIILIRSALLILLLTMLAYHSQLQLVQTEDNSHIDLWAECIPILESDVRRAIDDMLTSVPFALGDVDPTGRPTTMLYDGAAAIVIVHSIRLVSHCAYATAAQLQKASEILTRMNSTIGIRSAVGFDMRGYSDPRWAQEQEILRPLASSLMLQCQTLDQVEAGLVCLD
ncbi:hypothetical protein CDV31_009742 [Fusarium ambrosium]|uniref:Zn(2)-C6 fungal-type domain-containing protein n=1 Tax=Fusarium ambrosium TaxID=131363 RepID=A0A428TSS8_9HYPO|nr:hypothetical protein CDV31_009742 [Fusarium ambrosium]